MSAESQLNAELTDWFKRRLAQSPVQFGDEPMSYEANSDYDVLCYRLQQQAAEHWQAQHGYTPTPGQLMQAFFGAEYERFHQQKLDARPWREKLWQGCARWLHRRQTCRAGTSTG
ncbi:MAG: hypothetical protein ACKN9T_02440 [Candidatus Methylumidiphilus sp.]